MSWILKLRGDSSAPILAEYECPVHGRFEVTAPRPAPDVTPCPVELDVPYTKGDTVVTFHRCCTPSPWRFPMPHGRVKAGEVIQGKSDPRPPGEVMLDTRPLADGMPYSEWKAKQDKITADLNINRHRKNQGRTRKVMIG